MLRLIGVMNFILILIGLINIRGREPYSSAFCQKPLTLACAGAFIDQFLQALCFKNLCTHSLACLSFDLD